MGHDTNTLAQPPVKLDYSLTGLNSTLAVERGLAEADWYQSAVPRETMRSLLESKTIAGNLARDYFRKRLRSRV